MMFVNTDRPESLSPLNRLLNFLLVDDDDISLFIHRRIVELTGYCGSAHSANNGKTALQVLERAAMGAIPVPDIILLDLDMPIMNGLEFLQAFERLDCPNKDRIAIVLLTSSMSEKDKQSALLSGVAQCVSKPLTQEALNTVVNSLYKNDLPQPFLRACL